MGMTIEKAIERLEWFKKYNEEDYCGGDRIEIKGDWYYLIDERDFEAFDMAIKALGRESCDDFISRKAANDILRNAMYDNAENDKMYKALGRAKMQINNLPSVLPKHYTPCDLCEYAPASSADGKPCTMCPAERREA